MESKTASHRTQARASKGIWGLSCGYSAKIGVAVPMAMARRSCSPDVSSVAAQVVSHAVRFGRDEVVSRSRVQGVGWTDNGGIVMSLGFIRGIKTEMREEMREQVNDCKERTTRAQCNAWRPPEVGREAGKVVGACRSATLARL